MGGVLESRCVGRVYGAYIPATCRAKNTSTKLPCYIKLAFQIISFSEGLGEEEENLGYPFFWDKTWRHWVNFLDFSRKLPFLETLGNSYE